MEEEKDSRPDIYVLVTCYTGILRNLRASIVEEFEFHQKDLSKDEKQRSNDTETLKPNFNNHHTSTPHVRSEEISRITFTHDHESNDEPIDGGMAHEDLRAHESHHRRNQVNLLNLAQPEYTTSMADDRNNSSQADRKRTAEVKEDTKIKRKKELDDIQKTLDKQNHADLVQPRTSKTTSTPGITSPESNVKQSKTRSDSSYPTRLVFLENLTEEVQTRTRFK
ncbi:hypothetical protein RF11_00929 [Thelohanellus kitauei]|uniref:Uncharacterized protein n=1 Tax=Thelohanellus kitauei TaxID=669202 RepID=A0A0C2MVA2_THEKT|nr:hypothetical protein RF11_00929 [Thelohanellus kitauei]